MNKKRERNIRILLIILAVIILIFTVPLFYTYGKKHCYEEDYHHYMIYFILFLIPTVIPAALITLSTEIGN